MVGQVTRGVHNVHAEALALDIKARSPEEISNLKILTMSDVIPSPQYHDQSSQHGHERAHVKRCCFFLDAKSEAGSSDPNFWQSADCGKLGSLEAQFVKEAVFPPPKNGSFFLLLRSSVVSENTETHLFFRKKKKGQLLRSGVLDLSGVRGIRVGDRCVTNVRCCTKRSQEGQGALVFETNKIVDIVHDLSSVQQIQTRPQERLALWAIHLKSPTAALANAVERAEQKCGMASSATSEL